MTERSYGVQKPMDQLQPGDHIVLDLPCVVEITAIEVVKGSDIRGNRAVSWRRIRPVGGPDGESYIGSMVPVEVAPPVHGEQSGGGR